MFETYGVIAMLLIGLVAGFLAGKIMRGSGFGLIGDIIIGIIGAVIGSWLWGVLKLPTFQPAWLTAVVAATIGAVILLFIISLVKRR